MTFATFWLTGVESMSGQPDLLPPIDLAREYQALLQFIHIAPIGLVRCNRAGLVSLMNPMATQLLAPLDFGDVEQINIFDVLDHASKDIRTLVQGMKPCVGVLCDNYSIELPHDIHEPAKAGAPIALSVTVMQLPDSSAGDLMIVIQDGSAALKMQRLRSTWYR
jgi:hypothetical protein